MYCEYLLEDAKNGDADSLKQLYLANFGLVCKFYEVFGVKDGEKDDFNQLCYIALDSAVKAYCPNGINSFLSYFRRCVLHEFYAFKLLVRYPFRVPYLVEIPDVCSVDEVNEVTYSVLDDSYNESEERMISAIIWNEVRKKLPYDDYVLLYERFVKSRSYSEIAEVLHKDSDKLRFRQRTVLRKLRKDSLLKEIAADFYGIY